MKILVGTAWPFATARPHLGHAAAVFLPADVYARYQRLSGHDTLYTGGTDAWGAAATVVARELDDTPAQVVERFHQDIGRDLAALNVKPDRFSTTHDPAHQAFVHTVFTALATAGLLTWTELPYPYDVNGIPIPDRAIRGECRICGSGDPQRADLCGDCGSPLEAVDLMNPYAEYGYEIAEWRSTPFLALRLDRFTPQLMQWLDEVAVAAAIKERARRYLSSHDVATLTRPIQWGISLPPELSSDHAMTVFSWCDSLLGQLSICLGAPRHAAYWEDITGQRVFFVGADCGVYYATWMPALILAINKARIRRRTLQMPTALYSTFNVVGDDGHAMSSSRKSGYLLHELVTKHGATAARYCCLRAIPDTSSARVNIETIVADARTLLESLRAGIGSGDSLGPEAPTSPWSAIAVEHAIQHGHIGEAFRVVISELNQVVGGGGPVPLNLLQSLQTFGLSPKESRDA